MNRFIFIEVNNNIKRFINKCKKYSIELHNLNYINKDKIIVKIDKNDYDLIKKYNYYSEINIYKKIGLDNIKDKIFNQKYFILLFIFLLVFMYFVSNIIFKINVIHSNKNIRELVISELENYGIKKYSYKKSFNELEKIKKQILDNNKNKLEWISITNVGMTTVIRVEERIIDEIKKSKEYCNIISTKDSLITNIYGIKGEIIVNVNDIVKPNDILISGNILLNEENKGYICATGKVMGKVWYNTSITLERVYEKKEYTSKTRFNFTLNNKILRNIKYKNYDKKYLIKTKYFSIYKELEYKLKKYKYNEKESIEKALLEIDNKFKSKLGKNGKILNKKILSKSMNNNIVELKLFIITEEDISKQEVLNISEINKE